MQKLIYIIYVRLYPVIAALVSPLSNKAKLWLTGRRNIFENISNALAKDGSQKLWMHCASLSEFEQGRPLLKKLKSNYPDKKIVLTFFSSSGYEAKKNTKVADYVFYIPMDTPVNAKTFLDITQPSVAFFIQDGYWYFYLKELNQRKIPVFLVAGIFFPNSTFLKWYGSIHRELLGYFSKIFVQTKQSQELLLKAHVENVMVTGDTRFDRVLEIAAEWKPIPEIENFISNAKTIVAGSTWIDDDEVLDHYANTHPGLKFIIVPQDISKARLEECKALYKHAVLYSDYVRLIEENKLIDENINTLIIDNVGMLKFLYRYATICFIGGGFGNDGIHNMLEAVVYNKPVVFGPAYENFPAANELIEKGGAFDVEDAIELEAQLDELFGDENLYSGACKTTGDFVKQHEGATTSIFNCLQKIIA
ncbi:MAG: 3-deoxy-D-manno-octulosonic acid transferase [Bacteroidetes bacterium]|nr:3-deoxy-D-manno-octulosonic acid transferase [Bacteroidota bacterium]